MIDEQVAERMERFKEEEAKKAINSNAKPLPGAKNVVTSTPA